MGGTRTISLHNRGWSRIQTSRSQRPGLPELGHDLSACVFLLHNKGLLKIGDAPSERLMLVPAVIRSRRPPPKLGRREKGEGRNLPGPTRAEPFTFQIGDTTGISSGNLSQDMD